jgi:hypothetical protein
MERILEALDAQHRRVASRSALEVLEAEPKGRR